MPEVQPTNNPVPSDHPADARDNFKRLDEVLNLQAPRTSPTRTGRTLNTIYGLEEAYVQTPINGGVWAIGIEFTAYNQFMIFGGVAYKPKITTALPYTSTSSPDLDFVAPFSELSASNIGNYTDIVFNSIADMQAGMPGFQPSVGNNLKVQGENDLFTNYKVVSDESDVSLGGGLWAKRLDVDSSNLVAATQKNTEQDERIASAESDITALQSGQGSGVVGYATQSDLFSDLNHEENTVGYVTNDSTTENNGTYRKTGASGSGSWVQSNQDLTSIAYQNSLLNEERIERISTINSGVMFPELNDYVKGSQGGATPGLTWINIDNESSTPGYDGEDGFISSVNVNVTAAGNIWFKLYQFDGGQNWTFLREAGPFSVDTSTLSVQIPGGMQINRGDCIGYYLSNGAVEVPTTPASGGLYNFSGNNTIGGQSSNAQVPTSTLMLNPVVEVITPKLEPRVKSLEDASVIRTRIAGEDDPEVVVGASSNNNFIRQTPAVGASTITNFTVAATTATVISLRAYSLISANNFRIENTQDFTCSIGVNEFEGLSFEIEQGQYLGTLGSGIALKAQGTDDSGDDYQTVRQGAGGVNVGDVITAPILNAGPFAFQYQIESNESVPDVVSRNSLNISSNTTRIDRLEGSVATSVGVITPDEAAGQDVLISRVGVNYGLRPLISQTTTFALGDSTVAFWSSGIEALIDLIGTVRIKESLAVGGDTIAGQKAKWIAENVTPEEVGYVVIQIGLNDIDPDVSTTPARIAEMQDLVDTVRGDVGNTKPIFISKMSPARQRFVDLWGETRGEQGYQRWLSMNEAIAGLGSSPITNVDGRILSHEPLLNDGSGNLRPEFGVGDNIHTNAAGRRINADAWIETVRSVSGYVM